MTCPVIPIEAPAPPELALALGADGIEARRRWAEERSAWASRIRAQLEESIACTLEAQARAVRAEGEARAASLERDAAFDDAAWWETEAKRPRLGLLVAGLGVGLGLGFAGGVVLAR